MLISPLKLPDVTIGIESASLGPLTSWDLLGWLGGQFELVRNREEEKRN